MSGDGGEEVLHVEQDSCSSSRGREVPLRSQRRGFKERIEIIPNYSYASRDPAIDWMFAKLLQERIRTKERKGKTDPRGAIHERESRQHTC